MPIADVRLTLFKGKLFATGMAYDNSGKPRQHLLELHFERKEKSEPSTSENPGTFRVWSSNANYINRKYDLKGRNNGLFSKRGNLYALQSVPEVGQSDIRVVYQNKTESGSAAKKSAAISFLGRDKGS